MTKIKYKDYPIQECMREADLLIADGKVRVYQKFTCGKCGSRQTMPDANIFYTEGGCEECGHITDIAKSGCNYLTMTEY